MKELELLNLKLGLTELKNEIVKFAKGNWGHKGRPGSVGGSGGGGSVSSISADFVGGEFYKRKVMRYIEELEEQYPYLKQVTKVDIELINADSIPTDDISDKGQYYASTSTIKLAVKGAELDNEFKGTVLHEYGHHVYFTVSHPEKRPKKIRAFRME